MEKIKLSKLQISAATVRAVQALRQALKAEFGSDYAFTISGRGHVIAASNLIHGDIRAVGKEVKT